MCSDLPSRGGQCGHSLLHLNAHLVPHSLPWPGCHQETLSNRPPHGRGSWAQTWGPTPQTKPLSSPHSSPRQLGGPAQRWCEEVGSQSLGRPPSSHQQGPPTCPHADRHRDRGVPGKVGWSLFLGGPSGIVKQTQSRALQLMVSGFCLPFPTSFLPNSQLRVTTHPSPSSGKRGAAAPHYPGGSCYAGVSSAGKQ